MVTDEDSSCDKEDKKKRKAETIINKIKNLELKTELGNKY
jgi:hypothetical protein